ncbi:ABC transporter substrate-binding protein [Thalassospira sp. TSL5-1]|uniref:substrate-binding periplasmic protein n=1 Tax=Thalassospira sp. TSL5-1 TaxID=1544451 RepID=UPI00093D38F5|nr:ABC transporter substrate-binding protein [Thalassospira sp. TSL5-1]OKH88001.1 hypothetical protein LF95_15050 [Thalassospira sp. TSL5-1]
MPMRLALVFLLFSGVFLFCAKPVFAEPDTDKSHVRQRVVLYGEENNPPYAYLQGNVMMGIYTDILRRAALQMPQYDIEFSAVPFKRGIELLKRGEIMAFYPPYFKPVRDWVQRYSVPIVTQTPVVLCTDQFARYRTLLSYPYDYVGARFGNTSGYKMAGQALFNMAERHEVTFEEAHTTEINLRRLLAGRIDCYVNDRLAIDVALSKIGPASDEEYYHLTETALLGSHQGGVAYGPDEAGKWPFRDDFADALDGVLRKMHEEGEIDAILKGYMM